MSSGGPCPSRKYGRPVDSLPSVTALTAQNYAGPARDHTPPCALRSNPPPIGCCADCGSGEQNGSMPGDEERRLGDGLVPGLMEAVIPTEDESPGSTGEVP